jgi:hypothetical protein
MKIDKEPSDCWKWEEGRIVGVKDNGLLIAVDFDGTCVTHEYPSIGKDIGAAPTLRRLVAAGHHIILWTMRGKGSQEFEDALKWFDINGITLYGANENPGQRTWTNSPKAYAQYYIDDAAIGCPLCTNLYYSSRPFVDWAAITKFFDKIGAFNVEQNAL